MYGKFSLQFGAGTVWLVVGFLASGIITTSLRPNLGNHGLFKKYHPQMAARFRLVKYGNLPRYMQFQWHQSPRHDQGPLRKAMADADADGNGLISKSEMPDLLKGL